MRKFIVRFWALILTFILSTISTIFLLQYYPPDSFEDVDLSKIPSVEYCDVKNNPRKYDGKIIRIEKANLYFFTHGYFLADKNCSGEGDSARTAIDFYEAKREILNEELKKTRSRAKSSEPSEINVVGKFTYKILLGGSGHIRDRTPFQFEIFDVESGE